MFTVEKKDSKKRKVKKTYIYDKVEKYVIVLEQQRTNAFYLLTAYYLNREYGEKALLKKMKKELLHHYKNARPEKHQRLSGLETLSNYR